MKVESDRFILTPTILDGLIIVDHKQLEDNRGSFERVYCESAFAEIGLDDKVNQINISRTSRKGAVRGLHYQTQPHCEDKIVRCLRGKILDVCVDLRRSSSTFLKWHGEVLDCDMRRSILIPKGFAHGFQTLTDNCEVLYVHTAPYVPDASAGIHYLDSKLAINWPLPVSDISKRDTMWPKLPEDFIGVGS